ncbi:helix-turn-helix domain-containing protein [Dinoroseobacter sp. S76]|uniref:helix-turn-helix domain-containing protein n=1 Tax=Dinoroseobacter sp. S76 TaxID=3415124 RepID=UPI003C7E6D9D
MVFKNRLPADTSANPYAEIGARLRWHRLEFEKLRQADYAANAGLKRTSLASWETGTKRVSVDAAAKLRNVYGLSLDWLYCGDDANLPASIRRAWRESRHTERGRDWLRP